MAQTDIEIEGKVLLAIALTFFGGILTLWATSQNEMAFSPILTRITLTTAGC